MRDLRGVFVTLRAGFVVAVAIMCVTASNRAELLAADKLSMYGDFRFRAETDWDSQDGAGVEREDRTRLRIRFRAGFLFNPTDRIQVGARLRSGQEASQQSPHMTLLDFQDNDTGDTSFESDRWFVRAKSGGFEATVGRNDMPFWKQDEMLFDDDVTLPGVSLRYGRDAGPGKIALAGAYYTPPVGMTLYSGKLAAGQVSWLPEFKAVKLAFAAGAYHFEGDPNDPDIGGLLQGNGARDYSIVAAHLQARFQVAKRPLIFGADGMRNLRDYDPNDPDPVTAANFDETDGYVLLGTYGALGERNDWLVGYYFARIETLAINNSFAQDDWVRWGSATQTRSSNMKGHELRFAWALSPKMNLMARFYLAESITTVEDGSRFRLDFNYAF